MSAATLAPLREGPLDIHAHIMPEALIERLSAGERPGFSVESAPGGPRFVYLGPDGPRLPLQPGMADMDIRLANMAETGVEAQLLSPWIALSGYHLGEADALWFARALNAEIAKVVSTRPDRFRGIGIVPLQFPERAAQILSEGMEEMGLLGAEIATSVRPDLLLDDRRLDPFWERAESLGALVMIHPTLSAGGRPEFARYYLNNLVHNPLETTYAGAHLIFGGVLERFPALRILLVHGGGYLPYGIGRLRRGRLVRAEATVSMQGDIDASYEKFLFDTVTHAVPQLRFLVEEAGAARVLLGSDYPFDMADPDLVGTVRRAGLGERDEALVLRGNADRLLSLRSAENSP